MKTIDMVCNDFIAACEIDKTIDILTKIGLQVEADAKSQVFVGTHMYKAMGKLYDNITEYIGVQHDTGDMDRVMNDLLTLASEYKTGKRTIETVKNYIITQQKKFSPAQKGQVPKVNHNDKPTNRI